MTRSLPMLVFLSLSVVSPGAASASDDPAEQDDPDAPEAPGSAASEASNESDDGGSVPDAGQDPTSDEDGSHPEHDHDDPFPDHADNAAEVEVIGRAPTDPRGAGDVRVSVPETQAVHPPDAEAALMLAPGVLVQRNGGDGAPLRLFLRGFDARHGQDVAFHLDGLPVNQVGNPHGHGLVDLRLIPAEALGTLDVRPGPTDPSQGDFAVAGSIDLEPGLPEPGLLAGAQVGSFGTMRGILGWRHPDQRGTFVLGELYRTDGYGENRGGLRGTAVARVDKGSWRVTTGVAASDFDHAGFVRRVDVDEGRIGLYDTPDDRQGVGAFHAWTVGRLSGSADGLDWSVTASAARRSTWIRTNFTGFLTDDRRPGESDHDQRGDLLDQRAVSSTAHIDARLRRGIGDPAGRLQWAVESGARARVDDVDALSQRLRAVDGVPYRTELDVHLQQADVGLWAGVSAEGDGFVARVGGRAQAFAYQLLDRCAAQDIWFPDIELDLDCPDEDRNGARSPESFRTAAGLGLAPRASVAIDMAPGHRLLSGAGRGFRSIEASSLSGGEDAPFGDLWSADLGWSWTTSSDTWFADHRLVGFGTVVTRDLLFDEETGANVPAGSTRRVGMTLSSEVHHGPLRAHTSITGTYAVFGPDLPPSYVRTRDDRKAGELVPYVPPILARTDLTWTWRARTTGFRHGLAATAIGPRPLPWSTWSEPVLTLDASTEVRRGAFEVGLTVTNLLNARYASTETTFASWFPDLGDTDFPTRLPARHISPGAPRAAMLSVTLHPEVL